MAPLNRLLYAIGCAAAALMPMVAMASPSPSPTLDTVLIKPPTANYVEADSTTPGVLEGAFDAKAYVANGSPSNASQVQATLERDGFLSGYGRTWVQRATQHILVEAVLAFSGGDGAKRWLAASEIADKADTNYQHPISLGGIDAYYGAHFFYATNKAYADAFAFVKGNDYFVVATVSGADDLADAAATQTKAQFDSAPAYTIPPSAWPASTSAVTASFAYNLGRVMGYVLLAVLVLGVVLLAVGLVLRSRRRAQPAFAVAVPAAAPAVQMSGDGQFWWDGASWRNAEQEVPPTAQRSGDGRFWWDGRAWRPVS
jgi:hypothetical protein